MGLFEQFPYTNFHNLNLDWIVGKIKENATNLENATTAIPALIADAVKNIVINQDIDVITPQLFGAIADGVTDCTAAINTAIEEASKRNGIVYLPSGTYLVRSVEHPVLTDTAIQLLSDVTIIGSGLTTVIKSKNGDCMVFNAELNTKNIAILNLKIDGNYQELPQSGWHCVRFSGITNLLIANCEICNGQHYGIGFALGGGANNVTIKNCYIHDTGADCIDFKNSLSTNRNVTIDGCVFEKWGLSGQNYQCGVDYRGTMCTVSNCHFYNYGGNHIGVRMRETTAEQGLGGVRNVVAACTIDGVAVDNQSGLVLYSDCVASNCTINNVALGVQTVGGCLCTGLEILNVANGCFLTSGANTFSNNRIKNASKIGIRFSEDGQHVSGNTISNAAVGLQANVNLTTSVVTNNMLSDTDTLTKGNFGDTLTNNDGVGGVYTAEIDLATEGVHLIQFTNKGFKPNPNKLTALVTCNDKNIEFTAPALFNNLSAAFTFAVTTKGTSDTPATLTIYDHS